MNAIELAQLSKSYGSQRVLHDLSLTVRPATCFGFLGPNGAGKTTAIRILLGLLRADQGTARVFGEHVSDAGPQLRREIGYLPGDVRFHAGLTGRATLNFLAHARRLRLNAEIERLATRFEIHRHLDSPVRGYSRGMKQKLGIIQALMHRPRLLILDEPTTALDPLVRETLYAELRRVIEEGRTVLFSSHTLSEVEALCDEVAILRGGKLIEQERVEVLRARAVRRVELALASPVAALNTPAALHVSHHDDHSVRATWTGPVRNGLLTWLAALPVRDVTIVPPSLEDLFLAYYENETTEAATA